MPAIEMPPMPWQKANQLGQYANITPRRLRVVVSRGDGDSPGRPARSSVRL